MTPDEPPRGRALRVLIVEDSRDAADSLAVLLKLDGHAVQAVPDGPAALRMAEAGPPDVVLLDIGLPGMDGWEVARRLREQPAVPRPLLVAVTGYGQAEDRLRSEALGVLHFVKPVDPAMLRDLLRAYAARRGGP
jgi:CheY-like chemotaxis protein